MSGDSKGVTHQMLSKVDSRETALPNLFASSEIANDIVSIGFRGRGLWTPRARGRMPIRQRHDGRESDGM